MKSRRSTSRGAGRNGVCPAVWTAGGEGAISSGHILYAINRLLSRREKPMTMQDQHPPGAGCCGCRSPPWRRRRPQRQQREHGAASAAVRAGQRQNGQREAVLDRLPGRGGAAGGVAAGLGARVVRGSGGTRRRRLRGGPGGFGRDGRGRGGVGWAAGGAGAVAPRLRRGRRHRLRAGVRRLRGHGRPLVSGTGVRGGGPGHRRLCGGRRAAATARSRPRPRRFRCRFRRPGVRPR